MRLTDHHMVGTKRQLTPNINPPRLIAQVEVNYPMVTHMTSDKS